MAERGGAWLHASSERKRGSSPAEARRVRDLDLFSDIQTQEDVAQALG